MSRWSSVGTGHSLPVLLLGAVCLSSAAALIHLVNVLRLSESKISKSKIGGFVYLCGLSGTLAGSVLGGLIGKYVGLQNVFLAWIPVLGFTAIICFLRARAAAQDVALK